VGGLAHRIDEHRVVGEESAPGDAIRLRPAVDVGLDGGADLLGGEQGRKLAHRAGATEEASIRRDGNLVGSVRAADDFRAEGLDPHAT
jgi:hypothetical protein